MAKALKAKKSTKAEKSSKSDEAFESFADENESRMEESDGPTKRKRGGQLIIVESPTKARTIEKYLKGSFRVMATVGHIKDLPKKELGVDVENHFQTKYETIGGKSKVMTDIVNAAAAADHVYLAPDPDREGEAIAFHVNESIRGSRKVNKDTVVQRVLFHEITKNAILEALKKPLPINEHLFEAHKARRVLDRLVGYKISPVLWDKVRRGLSAGRVQSVAVRMICDREAEIRAFKSDEYWNITAFLETLKKEPIEAKLFKIGDKKPEVSNQETAAKIVADLQAAEFKISAIERKERKSHPVPPFITSKLQQDGANRLGFTAKKTMVLAQQLYEGMDLGDLGTQGLITYMRTDSVRVSEESIAQARDFIRDRYGKEHLPDEPNRYKTKKSAQDAHEAIRPTSMEFPPERVAKFLDRDQLRLYTLIWNRFIASQMKSAILDRTTIDISAKDCVFRATGSIVKYPGYLQVYEDEDANREKEDQKTFPPLEENQVLHLIKLDPTQHFTQPPPRYTESSLVKALEENGIGRPSTYATIMTTILEKDYVVKDKGKFAPTELGMRVTDLLVVSFPDILNIEFTANMENHLDAVEEGEEKWVQVLEDFYGRFKDDVAKAKKEMTNLKTQELETQYICEKCGSKMVIKWGRNGEFIACSGYPNCRNTKEFSRNEQGEIVLQKEKETGEICEKCGKPMLEKRGRFGAFIACSGYPECKNTKAISTGVKCNQPNCEGEFVTRFSRKGKIFYSCSKYPACKNAIWDKPVNKPCPVCQAPFTVEKFTKKQGTFIKCLSCAHQENIEAAEESTSA